MVKKDFMKDCTDKERSIYDFVLDINGIKVNMIKGLIDCYLEAVEIVGEREGRDQNSYILGCQDGFFMAIEYLTNYSFDS
jgi:hypothetical protein